MSDYNKKLQVEADIVGAIKTVYDPEIPVNVYELGLIYEIDISDAFTVDIQMTLTAPNCPVADDIILEIKEKVEAVENVNGAEVRLVFDPPWSPELMSEEAKLELGMLFFLQKYLKGGQQIVSTMDNRYF